MVHKRIHLLGRFGLLGNAFAFAATLSLFPIGREVFDLILAPAFLRVAVYFRDRVNDLGKMEIVDRVPEGFEFVKYAPLDELARADST